MRKIKVGMFGTTDALKFKKMVKAQNKHHKLKNLQKESNAEKVCQELHPGKIKVIVKDIIIENRDCKTFVLVSKDGKPLPYFKAGQYVNVYVEVDGELLNRSYTLSSSPKQSLEGEYRIMVKAVENGIVSNFLLGTIDKGEELLISEPCGYLTYNRLRDEQHIVGIAGGSGITPFYSLAQAIIDGDEDCILTIFYGAKKEEDLIFLEALDDIVSKTNKVKVVYVLSEERNAKYEYGLITRNLIERYVTTRASFFISGPQGLYEHINHELRDYDLPNKFFRYEGPASKSVPTGNSYSIRVKLENDEIIMKAWENETILVALNRAHVIVPTKCHHGVCSWCRTKLISGEVLMDNDYRRAADKKYHYIHPCVTYPKSDLILEVIK